MAVAGEVKPGRIIFPLECDQAEITEMLKKNLISDWLWSFGGLIKNHLKKMLGDGIDDATFFV